MHQTTARFLNDIAYRLQRRYREFPGRVMLVGVRGFLRESFHLHEKRHIECYSARVLRNGGELEDMLEKWGLRADVGTVIKMQSIRYLSHDELFGKQVEKEAPKITPTKPLTETPVAPTEQPPSRPMSPAETFEALKQILMGNGK